MEDDKIYTIDELEKKLTAKERIFCHEYIIDYNGSRAARKAKYSEKTCAEIAHENLRKPHIKQYIVFIKDDIEKEAGISKLRQLNELSKIAYSTISHMHECWIELVDWEDVKRNNPHALDAVESIDTKTEYRTINRGGEEESEVEIKYVKIKLYSKLNAIDQINKMLGYNAPNRIDHRSEDGSMTPQEKTVNLMIDGKDIDLGT